MISKKFPKGSIFIIQAFVWRGNAGTRDPIKHHHSQQALVAHDKPMEVLQSTLTLYHLHLKKTIQNCSQFATLSVPFNFRGGPPVELEGKVGVFMASIWGFPPTCPVVSTRAPVPRELLWDQVLMPRSSLGFEGMDGFYPTFPIHEIRKLLR